MDNLRLFIAINFSSDVKAAIDQFKAGLVSPEANIKWVLKDDYHITLKFLGDTSQELISDIKGVLAEVTGRNEIFKIKLQGTGVFPNQRYPKVVWLGIKGERDKLEQIHKVIDKALLNLGIPQENRPFSPHLTLGRVRGGELSYLMDKVREFNDFTVYENIDVHSISLMKSQLTSEGPIYKELFQLSLKKVQT